MTYDNTVIVNGIRVDFDAAVNLMDDDIRERLHLELMDGCSKQDFIDAYEAAHAEKFSGEKFSVA